MRGSPDPLGGRRVGNDVGTWLALEAFDQECATFFRNIEPLPPDELARGTNCPPWTLHELVVHVVFSITLPESLQLAPDAEPIVAADYYRRPERDTDAYRTGNVDRTRSLAASVDPSAVAALFRSTWERSSATFGAHDPDLRIEIGGCALTVESYLLTRIVAVAAHGVDAAITLERPAWTTTAALDAVRPVLVDLLGAEPPSVWGNQDLLEIGTGRRPLSDADRKSLGERATTFPLLS